MLEPRRAKMVPIISVFYCVTPAEVRWTQSKDEIYAQALKRLAKKRTHEGKLRYDSNTVKIGKKKLFHGADISGFELEACNIVEEFVMDLLNPVVKYLSEMLEKTNLPVADCPTG